jgi:hypothetical protein
MLLAQYLLKGNPEQMPRGEAFDTACKVRGIGFRGHYAELKRRLLSNESLSSTLEWYEMVAPDTFGFTYKGTALDPLLRHRMRTKLESIADTARWYKQLVDLCDDCGIHYEDMSRLELGMSELGLYGHDHPSDLRGCDDDPEWAELLEAREKLRSEQPAVTGNGNGTAA